VHNTPPNESFIVSVMLSNQNHVVPMNYLYKACDQLLLTMSVPESQSRPTQSQDYRSLSAKVLIL